MPGSVLDPRDTAVSVNMVPGLMEMIVHINRLQMSAQKYRAMLESDGNVA